MYSYIISVHSNGFEEMEGDIIAVFSSAVKTVNCLKSIQWKEKQHKSDTYYLVERWTINTHYRQQYDADSFVERHNI